MKNLSRFDLAMIIAFVVVALLGAAGWWWLSGALQTATGDASAAAATFDQYSKKEVFLPTTANVKTLESNIDIMTRTLDPLVQNRLQSPKNVLKDVRAVDTVEWKHNLDDQVAQLNAAAATHGIRVPKNFYYGFSRYLDTNPAEEATAVLKRQQIGIGTLANILIDARVKEILVVQRSAEEDANSDTSQTHSMGNGPTDILTDRHSVEAPGGVYTAYPFEFEFDTDTESLRTVINQIMQSEYVFIIRSIQVQNQRLDSPKTSDLDRLAGATTSQTSLIGSSPGAVGQQAAPTVGIQYLFGDETLHVRMMVDLIDWHGIAQPSADGAPGGAHGPHHHHNAGAGGGGNTSGNGD